MISRKVKVLIVDDSVLFRETLAKFLSMDERIEIVGKAGDPYDARDQILAKRPDVLTLDVEMPKMNGIEFLRKLIPQCPIPTVIVSSAPIKAFDALDAGAVDYVKKPSIKTGSDMEMFAKELKNKVITASVAQVRCIHTKTAPAPESPLTSATKTSAETTSAISPLFRQNYPLNSIIALGASTGGTDALQIILTQMPPNAPPIVIVQHMPPVFTKMFADRLNNLCKIEIKEAQNCDRLHEGLALLAPGDFQMKLKRDTQGYYVRVEQGAKVSGHCPSVDVLFESVAVAAGKNAVGAIMTGMGSDGAQGLLKMRNAGSFTIGQTKESCVVYGMPMVAYNIGACVKQVPLQQITQTLLNNIK